MNLEKMYLIIDECTTLIWRTYLRLKSIQIFDRSYCKRYSDTGKQLLNTSIDTLRYPAVINFLELVRVLGV